MITTGAVRVKGHVASGRRCFLGWQARRMMIKQIYIVECDICGKTEKARIGCGRYNEDVRNLPIEWHRGNNRDFCICPECYKALKGNNSEGGR